MGYASGVCWDSLRNTYGLPMVSNPMRLPKIARKTPPGLQNPCVRHADLRVRPFHGISMVAFCCSVRGSSSAETWLCLKHRDWKFGCDVDVPNFGNVL